jgi:hypothetical protein
MRNKRSSRRSHVDDIGSKQSVAMKTALNAAVALMLCASLLTGKAGAEAEPSTPAPELATPPPPGILVTPPRAPPADTQQSCPANGGKLELIV